MKLVSLPSQYQQFIHLSRYSRFREELGGRENWEETVDRYLDFVAPVELVGEVARKSLRKSILKLDVMPSMRGLMMAGEAAERCNVGIYNCAYTPIDTPRRFAEVLYILMCGTGVGFSVEKFYTETLPVVPDYLQRSLPCAPLEFVVEDSRRGWAEALEFLVAELYRGTIPTFDYSQIRPAGARLKTTGGRASGPEPLKKLIEFVIKTFGEAQGRRLKPLEVYDICCMIGEIVVVGGVRRSAMICLFDQDDVALAEAKTRYSVKEWSYDAEADLHDFVWIDSYGVWHQQTARLNEWDAKALEQQGVVGWWLVAPWRALSNNSAVYSQDTTKEQFDEDWRRLQFSGSGEPGLFNRDACRTIAERAGRPWGIEYGTNPCSEIILRPQQFCNLSEVVCRATDTWQTLVRKVQDAAILGTLQARFTDFDFLGPEWSATTKEEALLGVSMTGIWDGPELTDWQLDRLRKWVDVYNQEWAEKLGINAAAATTCVKPSGTVSQLVNSAAGMHAQHSPFYIRRVRADIKDPLTLVMMDSGVPWEPVVGRESDQVVFSFPMRAPEGATTRDDITALQQLNKWLHYQKHWCEHKPSVTINVRPSEWDVVREFVWENWEWMSGVAFLPYDGGTYVQAPYEACSEDEYEELLKQMPVIDWSLLRKYETEDETRGGQTFACTGGACEIVDLI